MSEFLPFMPEECEPVASIQIDNMEFLARRDNTVINSYLAREAFNNISLWDSVNNDWSIRIFGNAGGYEDLLDYMVDNEYPAFLNQPTVPSSVYEAYVDMQMRGVDDIESLE